MTLLNALYRYGRLKLNNALCRVMFSGKQPEKKHFLSVCAIFKNEGRFLKEWLDYHLLAGVEHFYLYDNGSDDGGVAVLRPYIDKGLVTLIDWAMPYGQMPAYNDCVEKYSAESNWIGFFDLDEFAVPLGTTDMKTVLRRYGKFPSLPVYWKMFGSNGIVTDDPAKPVTEQFTLCWDFNSYKSFLNTKFSGLISKRSRSPHFWRFKYFDRVCPKNPAYYAGLRKTQIRPDIQLNHYYSKSYDYFRNKKQIGRRLDDKQKLTLSVFLDNEHRAVNADYQIFRYMIELKTFDLDARGEAE